ncbi:MAG: DinB family protein [Myxococcales bacterium]
MSWLEQYRALARYNLWMNDRVYGLLAKLEDEERKRDRGAFFGSIHGTLNHILLGDRAWLGRLTGDPERFQSRDAQGEAIAVTSLGQELYADFRDLTRERAVTDADLLTYVNQLEERSLSDVITYRLMSGGMTGSCPRWWALTQLLNHETHHRGQVTTLMMQSGIDPGPTDFFRMMRDEDQR